MTVASNRAAQRRIAELERVFGSTSRREFVRAARLAAAGESSDVAAIQDVIDRLHEGERLIALVGGA